VERGASVGGGRSSADHGQRTTDSHRPRTSGSPPGDLDGVKLQPATHRTARVAGGGFQPDALAAAPLEGAALAYLMSRLAARITRRTSAAASDFPLSSCGDPTVILRLSFGFCPGFVDHQWFNLN
jgi:hypothetical protein